MPSSGVGSVVLNVTVVGPTAGSFLTLYPAGQSRPTASSINFAKSWLGSNSVTVKVGSGGKVSVYNHAGSTDVVVDVAVLPVSATLISPIAVPPFAADVPADVSVELSVLVLVDVSELLSLSPPK